MASTQAQLPTQGNAMPTLQMWKLEDPRGNLYQLTQPVHRSPGLLLPECFPALALEGLLWGNLPSGVFLGCYLSLPISTPHQGLLPLRLLLLSFPQELLATALC